MSQIFSLIMGWVLDLFFGDPVWLPHPVVWFGRMISFGEKRLNRGLHRKAKGAAMAVVLIALVFVVTWELRRLLCLLPSPLGLVLLTCIDGVLIFYCLAGTTLVREVRAVFVALDRGLDEGRRQVARIVGRDTSELTAQEVRTAALETLAENLSDGVVAPLFWLAMLGVPGMLAYKMVNTLDSMIGYRTERYRAFGCWAARIDDVANYVPARLTALLMVVASPWPLAKMRGKCTKTETKEKSGKNNLLRFVCVNGRNHASPNSGYPEAALAGILDCRFGGPHYYFGELFDKPYIGDNDRELTTEDMRRAVRVCRAVEAMMVVSTLGVDLLIRVV